ncbi:MAG: SpoIIE family protein phosphatase [Gemmatimonadota bacterium]|jgi:sigma-B regulation protein RsbU (phosphoserine phosphatase)
MTPEVPPFRTLPDAVQQTLHDLEKSFSLRFRVSQQGESGEFDTLYVSQGLSPGDSAEPPELESVVRGLNPRDGPDLELRIYGVPPDQRESLPNLVAGFLGRTFEFAQEVRFFTYELSERYEEINLLYSISETLGSLLRLDDAARVILGEVCDVLGARRGSLWVYHPEGNLLDLVAAVGEEGLMGPLSVEDPEAVTARVFREGRPVIVGRPGTARESRIPVKEGTDSLLSVPIRYTPPAGEPRTVGVINLLGRLRGGRFTASDQKLLSAIASQVGSALENHRLIQESLAQERVTREMELAHNLQMKLLPVAEHFEGAEVAARVQPAEMVGGDFFHLLHIPDGRIGVMIGDVSTHGFPAALIMALSMSAATIYAMEVDGPAAVLRSLDDALRDELETTEMYLSLFYGVLDPARGQMVYSNAGHPHAFVIHPDGGSERLHATDPPVGIAGPGSYAQEVVPWAPGEDLLLLFTDGISDTLGEVEGGGGEAIVLAAAIEGRHGKPGDVVDALFKRAGEAAPSIPADDRTVLILKV